ncbi:hypothetical protein [Thermopirellula anaerolimosa]
MKAYWFYTCELGHRWTLFREEDAAEAPSDAICPQGHEAVTLQKQRLLDMVQVAIRPAARVVDQRTGRIDHEYEYYLVVTDLHNNVERMSRKPLSWSDAKAALDRFRVRPDKPGTVTAERAWEIMDVLDAEPTRGAEGLR